MTPRVAIGVVVIALASAAGAAVHASAATYRVVPDKSTVRIEVGKSGAFGFVAGHAHEVEGQIHGTVKVDPSEMTHAEIHLTIRAADLRVSGKGEPPADVPKVQERMLGPDVLDVARFPEIAFRSTSVAAEGRHDGGSPLRVTGEVTLHGQTKPVSALVQVRIDGASLTASGTFVVKQTDFNIKPVSIAGVVNVKDALTIHFTVTAAS
jgi:polyisoprenoid-binding protein YceI